jgi:hypothetical protein
MIIDKLDPGHDGMVLKSDIVYTLLLPATNRISLERLAQERHARGIYSRLRDRRADPPSSHYRHAPIFDARARHEGLSSMHQHEGLSSMRQQRDAQSTGAPAVGGERVLPLPTCMGSSPARTSCGAPNVLSFALQCWSL